jgi:hypothetical protein
MWGFFIFKLGRWRLHEVQAMAMSAAMPQA